MNQESIRQDQRDFARNESRRPIVRKGIVKPVPKGHEAFLKALEQSGTTVIFEKASSGEQIIGKVKTSDKYTVSVMVTNPPGSDLEYSTRVLFKHDISEFTPVINPSNEVN